MFRVKCFSKTLAVVFVEGVSFVKHERSYEALSRGDRDLSTDMDRSMEAWR